tara:strand:- start:42 stop:215 length:174 start_codon:yes stop_codon:yes gene_type:complete
MKIYRDINGHLINIGEWEYKIEDGIESNPLPEGSYEDQASIVTGLDGGLYLSGDSKD